MTVIRRYAFLLILLSSCCAAAGGQEWTTPASLQIWYQPGAGESDAFLADWPQLKRILAEQNIAYERLDVAHPLNTLAARSRGITHLPAIRFRGCWHQGYRGLEALLGWMGLSQPSNQPPEDTPPPEQPPHDAPPEAREDAPEAVTATEFDEVLTRIKADQDRQDADLQNVMTGWQSHSDERQAEVAELRRQQGDHETRLEDVAKASDDRWIAITRWLQALQDEQQAAKAAAAGAAQPAAQNKEFHEREGFEPPDTGVLGGKWVRVAATAAKIGLTIAAPEVALPLGGLAAAGSALSWLVFRRRRRPAPAHTDAGRPEVRPEPGFCRLHRPPAERVDSPGKWEQLDNGTRVRTAAGGPVPDRFAEINPGGDE